MTRIALWISRALNDESMALLALLTVLAAVAPFAFQLTPGMSRAFLWWDVVVLAAFALEYGAGIVLARSKIDFLRDPWRLLDAFIIVATLVSLLPLPTDALAVSPALRLIRFVRLAVLGTRSSARLTIAQGPASKPELLPVSALRSYALEVSDERLNRFQAVTWEQLLERIGSDDDDWLYVSGVADEHLSPIAETLKVPRRVLYAKLFESAFPRIDSLERFVMLFCWYPQLVGELGSETAEVKRTGLLLVGSEQNVAVLVRDDCDLLERLEHQPQDGDPGTPALVNATHALVREVIQAYVRVAEHLETRLVWIESVYATLRDGEFLQRTFELRSEVSRVRTNMRHLANVTRNLNSRRIAIRGFEVADLPQFQLLASSAADTFERVDDLHQNLTALVDMRLNVSSFQMNKVMRLLAVLTALALIPSIAGGMLGMNLMDSPWSAALPQVVFWVGSGMAFSLYLFAIKGWLR